MLFEKMGNLFGRKLANKQEGETHSPKNNLRVLTPYDETTKKLERIITRSDLVNSGRVHLLGLDKVRKGLEDKWPELRNRILEHLNKIILSRISAKDIYFSRSDEEHIIVFSNTSDNEARLICAKILMELSEIYLGSVETKDITVKTACGNIEGKLLFETKSLDEIFNEVSFVNVEEMVNDGNEELQEMARHILSHEAVEAPYKVVFRPIWDSRNEAISTFMVNVNSLARSKKHCMGYDVLINQKCAEAVIGLDHIVLMETINTMEDFFQNNFRAIFSIPICYETLFNTDRLKSFLSRCQIIPPELHKYISFSLINFPNGVPESKLSLIVSSLMNYSRAVIISCDHIPHNVSYFKACGIKGISLKLPSKGMSPVDFWKHMTVFVQKCKKNKIYTSLADINHQDDLILAKEIGVNFMSGDLVGSYNDIPRHMARVSWKELIAK